jgi:hypothetical protein
MPASELTSELTAIIETDEEFAAREEMIERQRIRAEDIATPFVAPISDFERIVDAEEAAAADGAMLKDAMTQERLTDQIRRIEFDMEPEPERTNDLTFNAPNAASFERVTDADGGDHESGTSAGRTPHAAVIAASLGSFEDADDRSPSGTGASFERISDDEARAARCDTFRYRAQSSDTQQEEDRPRRTRSRRGGKKQGEAADVEATSAEATSPSSHRQAQRLKQQRQATKRMSPRRKQETKPRRRRSAQPVRRVRQRRRNNPPPKLNQPLTPRVAHAARRAPQPRKQPPKTRPQAKLRAPKAASCLPMRMRALRRMLRAASSRVGGVAVVAATVRVLVVNPNLRRLMEKAPKMKLRRARKSTPRR